MSIFMIKLKRTNGILLHISSLPGSYGIGEIGPEAVTFIDDLVEMGQTLWQILPDNPTDEYHSPYSATSVFAYNPLLISIDNLIRDGWLNLNDVRDYPETNLEKVNYLKFKKFKENLLLIAADNFKKTKKNNQKFDFENYCKKNQFWLDDYALFCTIQNILNEQEWIKWPSSYRFFDRISIENIIKKHRDKINQIKIIQFLYDTQWKELKSYANHNGIKIIGDIPIYVSFNSVDVWVNQKLFKLDENSKMRFQSGCPPDSFVKTGQVWGHPIYDWNMHEKDNFNWWINRILFLYNRVDIIRIDHFNGFAKYWEIPASDNHGLNGKWKEGPGKLFFEKVFDKIKSKIILAEDLGEAYNDAKKIRDVFNIPGMRILQFSFGNGDPYHNMDQNTVLYTGTHDNSTCVGWFNQLFNDKESNSEKNSINLADEVIKYIDDKSSDPIHWKMIFYAMSSKASYCILPLQDILGLDNNSRMNVPGTIGNNWIWRYKKELLNEAIKEKLKLITQEVNRI
mgnify:CR=1 FL=1